MAYALSYDKFDDPEYSLIMMNKSSDNNKAFSKKRRLKLCGFKTTYDVNSAMNTMNTTTSSLNSTSTDDSPGDILRKCSRCANYVCKDSQGQAKHMKTCKLCERKKLETQLDAFTLEEKRKAKRESNEREGRWRLGRWVNWYFVLACVILLVITLGVTIALLHNDGLSRSNMTYDEHQEVQSRPMNGMHAGSSNAKEVPENKRAQTGRVGFAMRTTDAALLSDYPDDRPSSGYSTIPTLASTVSFVSPSSKTNSKPKAKNISSAPDQVVYVIPKKNSPSLHVYDKIYDETRNITTSLDATPDPATGNGSVIVHSGHFRDKTAEVFDPHPQYVINATHKDMVLELIQDVNFRPPTLRVVSVSHNFSRKHEDRNPACYYTGTVNGEPHSHVGVSLCNGMTGYIKTSHGDYHITPDEDYDPVKHSKTSIRHKLTNMADGHHFEDALDVHDNDEVITHPVDFQALSHLGEESLQDTQKTHHRATRSVHSNYLDPIGYGDDVVEHYYYQHYGDDEEMTPKRSEEVVPNQPYYIATMVVADRKMLEYHKNEADLTRYILTLMSHAALLFKDATIGNPIALVVVDIVILNHTDFSAPSSPEILRRFCDYQHKYSHKKHDVALLLTRDVICKNASVEVCTTLGVAEVGSMCNSASSCAVVRDKGLSTSFTIAHELGHVLSMPHDDDRKCNKIRNGTKPNFIMARSLHTETQPWHWSQCSKHYLTDFLNGPGASCLLDVPHEDHMRDNPLRPRDSLLPGEAFQADQQCALEFGPGSRICDFMPKCSSLWCTHEFDDQPGDSGCKTQYMPWADGTPCGHNMWCLQGSCVSKSHFRPVHGGWGSFIPHGNCTRPCGGGIQMSVRECNNPVPTHGGSYCVGPSHHYKSCNSHLCPKNTPDFREIQCAQFNGNSKGLHGLDHNVRWVPKYGSNREDACKLFCRVDLSSSYYQLENKVLDGTKCGLNSFDICVNGVCMKGGCDNVLGSNITLDDCGVCDGNNKECCRSTGFYNKTNYGYHHVIQIPKGSSNIVIRQRALGDSDENYLALREPHETSPQPNRYHLNGNSVISGYTKDIIYGGLTFKYSGSNNTEESIVTPPKAKLTKDIVVEVLQVGNVTHPNIEWSYTIPCRDTPNYSWEYYNDKWTDCNSICRGYRYPLRKCKDLVKMIEVSPMFCENQLSDNPKECNTHCEIEWSVVQKGACSAYCGLGWRSLTHECTKIDVSSKEQQVIDKQHCRGIPPPPSQERCEGNCEDIRWQYEEWSQCSKSCGGGYQERRAICSDSDGNTLSDEYCQNQEKHVKQVCNDGLCPTWIYHDWSACSATCGTGTRRRQASCRIGNRLMPHYICPHPRPAVEESICNETPCHRPIWMYGDWNDCSGECGDSFQRRLVTCMDMESESTIPEEQCSQLSRPDDTRRCDLAECVYEWVALSWGKCSKTCGEGWQTRQVHCTRKDLRNGQPEEDQYCDGLVDAKPATTRKCTSHCTQNRVEKADKRTRHSHGMSVLNRMPDHTSRKSYPDSYQNSFQPSEYSFKWVVHKHSTTLCSTSCGTGYRNRTVSCIGTARDGETYTFTDAQCEHIRKKPSTTVMCKRYHCSHAWLEANWSPCSVTCGIGIRHRQVTCNLVQRQPQLHFMPTESSKCAMLGRPHSEERCSEMDCNDLYRWKRGEWEKCQSPCKDEKQFREVYCVDRESHEVNANYCKQLRRNKPRRRRKCGNRICPDARSCRELQRVKNERRNNDYWLKVGQRRAKIYCYKMDTDHPEEFISLLDGESNFSEVYVRTGHARECPTDVSASLQRTKFWKLRLDLSTMTIMTEDFTHSRSRFNNHIPLGRAGDCFGRFGRSCTRGRFRIDLSRSSFRLASDISWIPYGQSPRKIIKSTNVTISGQCGGNCGGCKFNPNIGIKVEVT